MRFPRIIIALLAFASVAHSAPVSKLAAEWHVPSESSTKQFSLVDAATGTVRTAFVSSDGDVSWLNSVATGISDVSDVASGLTGESGEMLAITSPLANRVALVELDALDYPVARVLPPLSGIGPSALSELRVGATRELLVTSIHNGGTNFSKSEVRHQIATTGGILGQSNFNLQFRRTQPLVDPSTGDCVAFYTADNGPNTATGILLRSGPSVTRTPKSVYGGALEFIPGVLDENGSAGNPLILGYRAGASNAAIVRVNTPIGTTAFSSTITVYPFPVGGVIPVTGEAIGPLTDGFIAIAADGSEARWLRINSAGNAIIETDETFLPDAGSFLSGIIPLPGIGLVQSESSTPGGPSSSFKSLLWDGSDWFVADSGNLPQLPTQSSLSATLLYYSADPAADEAARLLGVENVPDWTRRSAFPDPVPASVIKESFLSSAGGLVINSDHKVFPPFGTQHVMTNQVAPDLSIAAMGGAAALFSPELRIEPSSGTYDASFQIAATYDQERYQLLWRDENRGTWAILDGTLAVAYSRTLQFSLRSLTTNILGPIERRVYQISAASLASQDSDGDGVPDYVEAHLGLDPFGGPDHDGDGRSDLFEILDGTDPNNPASVNPLPDDYDPDADPEGVSTAGGFRLVALATNHLSQEILNGEEMAAHDLTSGLLARRLVGQLAVTLPDGGKRGAVLSSTSPVPFNEVISLAAPLYFNTDGGGRNGREMIRFLPADPPPPFIPVFTPGGSNLKTDADGWIDAARLAAANRPIAPGISPILPVDSAIAVLLEDLVHRALVSVRPEIDPAPALENFTLLPARESDRLRIAPSQADIDLLKSAGFDFRLALALAEGARSGMGIGANGIYLRHAGFSASTPVMLMPIDAMRILLRGGSAPAGYLDSGLTPARDAYNSAVAAAAGSFRPIAHWTIEIPETSLGRGVYSRLPGNIPVVLLRPGGGRFLLEQGLGLRPGTQFNVAGFSDTPDDGPFPTLEITAASLFFQPESSDRDTDGNLLDDEWERFFFGTTGQDPFSRPGSSAHSLLQYFLDGLDPRGDALPVSTAVSLAPQLPVITPATAGAYTLDFVFPKPYQDRFGFVLEKSTTLTAGSFIEIPEAIIAPLGGDELRASIPAAAATTDSGFFRIRLKLR